MKKDNVRSSSFWEDQSGDFGIKQIAATVAVIVVIGFVVTAIQSNIGTWVNQVWDLFMRQIQDLFT